MLTEVGCDKIRFENLMSGHLWRKDAYICLMEAVENIRKHMNRNIAVHLSKGSYDPKMPREIDANMASYDMQKHRPVGLHPHIFEGFNMMTVFVESAETAKRHT